ncbi:sulfite exporter TauE/SafE family protein [Niallia endozanthoxylica]|uniref:Probable membrane transporter protein n=1 Tax=Niallia endozanthoxylica TaxID=2036016 RepID=A0A5J5HI85_9BACI|nr:sulfite exporter TauE/SafE family protein [Niallia endozanthoxylica]KAA9019981.1 sulfite exporter TauE/SafE family protein [Niallia endozanthoxylica]
MEYIILVLLGFIAGTIGSLVGLGGGIVIVPALLFLGGSTALIGEVSPQVAAGTSLLVIIFTGLSSTIAYYKQKRVDYKSGLIFFIGSGPAGMFGAWVNKQLDVDAFSIWFGIFMIFMSFILMFKDKLKPLKRKSEKGIWRTYIDEAGNEQSYGYRPLMAISISIIVGFLGGLLGIGGGSLMVPAMILLFFFPPHIAVATSMLLLFLTSITSSVTHIIMGNINWLFALALIPGAWFGGQAGALLNQKLPGKTIVTLLRIVLIIVGIRLIFSGL